MAASNPHSIDAYEDDEFHAANTVLAAISQWFRGQWRLRTTDGDKLKQKIAEQRKLKGGWEKWLQNELALFLEDKFGYNVKDGREKYIYTKAGFVDLWCVPYSVAGAAAMQQTEALGIELKCEYQDKSCQGGFIEDVIKVCAGIKAEYVAPPSIKLPPIKAGQQGWIDTQGTEMLCLALTTRESDLYNLEKAMPEAFKAVVEKERNRVPFYYRKLWTATKKRWDKQWDFHEGPMDLWMIWFECHFYKRDGQVVRY